MIPFLLIHTPTHAGRLAGIESSLAGSFIMPRVITESVAREPHDPAKADAMVTAMKDVLIGYVRGLHEFLDAPWRDVVEQQRRRGTTLEQDIAEYPWLRPPVNAAGRDLFGKHVAAWRIAAASTAPCTLVAEDDIHFFERTVERLRALPAGLPAEFDYIDVAGGCGLQPRAGNAVVNHEFFRMDPPRDRTTCAYIVSRQFAQRLLKLDLQPHLPIDWAVSYAFTALSATVYWQEPTIFGHGSEIGLWGTSTG